MKKILTSMARGCAKGKFAASLGVWIFFTFLLDATGTTVRIPVTPASLNQDRLVFSVKSSVIEEGTAFQISIAMKDGPVLPDSNVGLYISSLTENLYSLKKVESVQVTVSKEEKRWKAEFVIPGNLLDTPGLSFIFAEYGHATVDGKTVPMPSLTHYEINLREFLPHS